MVYLCLNNKERHTYIHLPSTHTHTLSALSPACGNSLSSQTSGATSCQVGLLPPCHFVTLGCGDTWVGGDKKARNSWHKGHCFGLSGITWCVYRGFFFYELMELRESDGSRCDLKILNVAEKQTPRNQNEMQKKCKQRNLKWETTKRHKIDQHEAQTNHRETQYGNKLRQKNVFKWEGMLTKLGTKSDILH